MMIIMMMMTKKEEVGRCFCRYTVGKNAVADSITAGKSAVADSIALLLYQRLQYLINFCLLLLYYAAWGNNNYELATGT